MFTQTGNLNSSTSSNSPFTGNSNSNNKNASPFSSFNPFQLARQQQQPNQHNQTQQNPFGNFNNGGFNGKQKQRRSQNTNNEFSKNKTLINNNNQFHGSSGDFGFANSNTPNFLDGDNGNFNNNNSQGKRRGQQRSNRGRGGGNQNGGPQGHNTRINSRQNSPFTLTPGQNQFIPQQQQTPFSSTSQNSAFNGQPLRSIPVLPTSSGFKPRPRNLAIRPSYLEEEAASYTQVTRQPDIWDVNNQQELLNMEQLQYSGMDLESLYKKFQEMRELERQTMEEKGLVDRQNVRKNLKDAIEFVGTCQDMCPTFERVRRSFELDTKPQERGSNGNATRQLAVKAFSRPAAGQPPPLPSDVRPPKVLVSTLRYLIDKVVPELPQSHTFLWDRTRSIRQDFTYQNFIGPEAILCNELIARIHITSLHVMLTSDVEYSKQQELEQFNKTLQTLSELYTANRKLDSNFRSPREPELRAYQLLSHIYDPEVLMQIQALPRDILDDPRLQLALTLRSLVQYVSRANSDNPLNLFASFFSILAQNTSIPYLYLCLLETHFHDIRTNALASMSHAYHSRGSPYITSRLTTMLGFSNDLDTISFCTDYGLKTVDDEQFGSCVIVTVDPKNLTPSTASPKTYPSLFIDARKGSKSWSACIYDDPAVTASFGTPISNSKPFGSSMAPQAISSSKPATKIPFSKTPNISASSVFPNGSLQVPKPPSAFSNAPAFSQPVQSSSNFQMKPSAPTPFGGFGAPITQPSTLPSVPTSFKIQPAAPSSLFGLSQTQPSQQHPAQFANPTKPPADPSFATPLSGTPPLFNQKATKQPAIEVSKPPIFALPNQGEIKTSSQPTQGLFAQAPPVSLTTGPIFPSKPLVSATPANDKHIASALATPIATPVVQPVAKPKPQYVYSKEESELEAKRLLKGFILRSLRDTVVPGAWKQVQEERRQLNLRKDEACKQETEEMLREILVEQAMIAKAKQMDALRLQRLIIQRFSAAAYRATLKAEEKQRRKEEYLRISSQLGRPRVASANFSHAPRGGYLSNTSSNNSSRMGSRRTSDASSHMASRLSWRNSTHDLSLEKIAARINRAQQISENLWVPLNFASLSLPSLERVLRTQAHVYGETQLLLSCFCREWEMVAGKWIKTKLALGTGSVSSPSGATKLALEQLRDDIHSYRNMIQLAFVCGLGDDGLPTEGNKAKQSISEYDAAALAAILQKVIPHSLYKVQLLVISWTDLSEAETLSLLNVDSYREDLASVSFCSISESSRHTTQPVDPSKELENGIVTMTAQFSGLLSPLGQEIRQRERLTQQMIRHERQKEEQREAQLRKEEAKNEKMKKLYAVASLNPTFGTLSSAKRKRLNTQNSFDSFARPSSAVSPGSVSTNIDNSWSTIQSYAPVTPTKASSVLTPQQSPLMVSPSSTTALHSGSNNAFVPKGVRELRELTASVTKRPRDGNIF